MTPNPTTLAARDQSSFYDRYTTFSGDTSTEYRTGSVRFVDQGVLQSGYCFGCWEVAGRPVALFTPDGTTAPTTLDEAIQVPIQQVIIEATRDLGQHLPCQGTYLKSGDGAACSDCGDQSDAGQCGSLCGRID